jgi:hypothetical protein
MLTLRTRLFFTIVFLVVFTVRWQAARAPASVADRVGSVAARLIAVRHGAWRPTMENAAFAMLLVAWAPWTFVPPALLRRWFVGQTVPAVAAVVVLTPVALLFAENTLDVTTASARWVHLTLAGALCLGFVVHSFLAWRTRRRAPSLPRLGRLSSSFVALTFGVAWLLFAVEASARAFPLRDTLALNPALPHLWPDYFLPRNSLGCKDREPGPKRGLRILVLGDSYAEGAGVPWNERFATRLERTLRASNPDVEVYCAGECGFDTFNEAIALGLVGVPLEPDIVVVAYVLNDAEGESPPSRRPPSRTERFVLGTLRSYAAYRVMRTCESCGGDECYELIRRQHADDSPGWARAQRGLDSIADYCRRRQAQAVCVVLPIFSPGQEAVRPTMEKVARAAQQRGFESRHLLDEFDGHWERYAVSEYDSHPNAAAHAIIARVLAEMIGDQRRPSSSSRKLR